MTPLWVRLWHWAIALLFVILVFTGAVMTYSTAGFALMDYGLADTLHQVIGILYLVLLVLFAVAAGVTGYWRRYQRWWQNLGARIGRFGGHLVRGASDADTSGPSRLELSRGFLILIQQWISILSLVVLSPLLIVTGLVLLYPELLPETVAGLGGIWPFALAHLWAGLAGALFLLVHVYIATIGGLKRMIRGR